MEMKEIRQLLNLTQEQMATKLGISLSYYIKIEIGQRKISANFLQKLKTEFPNIDINIFFNNNYTNSV